MIEVSERSELKVSNTLRHQLASVVYDVKLN